MRADQLLVARGLARSRTLARRLIESGAVAAFDAGGQRLRLKPATELASDARLALGPDELARYVSRGGLKLAGAIAAFGLEVRGWRCLDVGQSTGGFTDCLLQHGAAFVCGIEVGHDQLDPELRADPRVRVLERLNIRDVDRRHLAGLFPGSGADAPELVVADLSFISLRLVLPALARLAVPATRLVALVKPQFEAGRPALDRHGIVRSPQLRQTALESTIASAREAGWTACGWIDSPITGADGNHEFFLHARRQATADIGSGARAPEPPRPAGDETQDRQIP